MALPSNVNYGTVVGQFLLAYADSNDADLFPDGVPAKGSVFFTPSPTKLANASSSPNPVTIMPAVVECQLDTNGYILGYTGDQGVRLVATDDADLNPVDWTWSAQFRLTDQSDVPISLATFSFELPAGTEVDLATAAPVSSANGTFYLVGPTGPANTLSVGTTTTLAPSADATVEITGTAPDQTINVGIPEGIQGTQGIQGIQGVQGVQGDAATIAVGTVTTGNAGTSVIITNTGTTSEAVFAFTVPKGDTGSLGTLSAASPITYSSASTEIGLDYDALVIDGGTA